MLISKRANLATKSVHNSCFTRLQTLLIRLGGEMVKVENMWICKMWYLKEIMCNFAEKSQTSKPNTETRNGKKKKLLLKWKKSRIWM